MKKYICLIICAALVSASCSHVMDDFKKDSRGNQTPYTVEHWQQNISDDDYTLVSADTQTLTGTTGAPLAYGDSGAANTYTGFTYSAALTSINGTVSTTGTIAADGSTVVKLYYNRNIITLTFDLAGGTTSTTFTATTSTGGTLSGKYGAAVSIENPTKTGYTFSAWNPDLPATFPAADASYTATYTLAGDYNITYNLAGGTNAATNPASYNLETETITLAAAAKTGYIFGGWYSDSGFTAAVTQIAKGSTGAVTLYALWSNTLYSVAFNANDTHATGTMSSQTIYTKVKTALTANAFTYTGYVFKGWATSTGGMAAYADGASVTNLASEGESITLYAVWSVSNVSSPADVKGTAALPVIITRITDHLYLASSAAGTSGYIACQETSGASAYKWWASSDGTSWSEVSGKTSSYLQFTAASDTVVYYCMSATSSDGTSTAYSNVCTVECGTEKTNKIGQIYYTDGTVSSSYESGRTPAGIVSDVKPDGSVKTIVALEQNSGAWAPSGTTGYNTTFATSLSDGKGNWAVIQAADPEGSK